MTRLAGAAALCVGVLLAGPGAGAQTSDVTVTLATLEQGVASTGPLFGGNEVLQYEITVTNHGSAPTGVLDLTDRIPTNSVYVAGSATCGDSPGCTAAVSSPIPKVLGFTVTFILASVAAGSSAVLDFQVTPRSGSIYSRLTNHVTWSGSGCPITCTSNRVAVQVLPRDVLQYDAPANNEYVTTGQSVYYTFLVHNFSHVVQDNVVVADDVPQGTQYVPGTATCFQTPGCTLSDTGPTITFTIASIPPDRLSNHYMVGFWATVTSTSDTIRNVGTWTGADCDLPTPCPTNEVDYPVIGGATPDTTTTTTMPPATQSLTAPTEGPRLELSPATIAPGGSTSAHGRGCPSDSLVVVTVDGRIISSTTADSRGEFTVPVSGKGLAVGQHTVTAVCGSTRMSTTLTIVVTASGNSPESSAAYFGVFVLLGGVLLRGQFTSDVRKGRRRKGRPAPGSAAASAAVAADRPTEG